jgi:hypothetical protein
VQAARASAWSSGLRWPSVQETLDASPVMRTRNSTGGKMGLGDAEATWRQACGEDGNELDVDEGRL